MSNGDNMDGGPWALHVQDICKRFGTLWANRRVTLGVRAGGILGLLGPNGAGKTTLIRICAGLVPADSGTVEVGGTAFHASRAHQRAMIGVVSRDVPLIDELSPRETLALQAALHGMRGRERAMACVRGIEEFGLASFADRRVDRLSSGMRQRTALAAAVVHTPAVLLLDEPTLGLDPDARHVLWECLKRLVRSGTAILLTTHYLEEACGVCSDVVVMVNGTPAHRATVAGTPAILDLEQAYHAALDAQRPPEAV